MIQSNELRIGNWVKFKERDLQIEVIHPTSVAERNLKETGNPNYPYDWKLILLREIEPVFLTENILLKCGFEKVSPNTIQRSVAAHNGDTRDYDAVYYLSIPDIDEIWIGFIDSKYYFLVEQDSMSYETIEVSGFHALQNRYFSLSGKELNI